MDCRSDIYIYTRKVLIEKYVSAFPLTTGVMYIITKWFYELFSFKVPPTKVDTQIISCADGQQRNFNKAIKSTLRDMSTKIKLIVPTQFSAELNATTRCYNFVSGPSGGKRIRRPLEASSSIHRRCFMSAELMFSLASLLFSGVDATSSTS